MKEGEILFGESKTPLLMKRVKKNIDTELLTDKNRKLLIFENLSNRCIWISAVNEHVYLNVKEKKEKGKTLL